MEKRFDNKTRSDRGLLQQARSQAHASATQYARYTGCAIKVFRETWGLKIAPAFLVQTSCLASLRLIQEMRAETDWIFTIPAQINKTTDDETYLGSLVLQTPAAFEECFRILLAAGSQQGLPRAMVQMAYLSAQKISQYMPPST